MRIENFYECLWCIIKKLTAIYNVHFRNLQSSIARRTGSDGSMSASGSAGLGFDPWRGSKFSFESFQPRV